VVRARNEELKDFIGPIDLILHLLSKNRMEIKDIQISLILSQYLEWMEKRKSLDLEVASEFIAMASHLLYIKTRMLLSINDAEALSEMEQLIASLQAYRCHENYEKVKSVTGLLEARYRIGRDYFAKSPEPTQADRTYSYLHEREDLCRAMYVVLERVGNKLPPPMTAFSGVVGREPYPVAEKAAEILQRLVNIGVTRFRMLFRGNRSRSEVVATFIAVLELCKARRLSLAGTEEDCTVTCTLEPAGEGTEFTADSY